MTGPTALPGADLGCSSVNQLTELQLRRPAGGGVGLASRVVEPDDHDVENEPALDEADLAELERELGDVDVALERLDADTYWTDEITGEPIPDERLERDPVARRAS